MALITSESKALDGNLTRRRQWINAAAQRQGEGEVRPARCGRDGPRPDLFAGNVGDRGCRKGSPAAQDRAYISVKPDV